jgi:hypothetical protein
MMIMAREDGEHPYPIRKSSGFPSVWTAEFTVPSGNNRLLRKGAMPWLWFAPGEHRSDHLPHITTLGIVTPQCPSPDRSDQAGRPHTSLSPTDDNPQILIIAPPRLVGVHAVVQDDQRLNP